MRFWMLVVLLNGLFTLFMYLAAPEMLGSNAYYAGGAICALIALVITWRDKPDILDNMLVFLFKWGILAAGIAFLVWGVGYKLEIWGEHYQDELVSSAFDTIMPNLALMTGFLIVFAAFLRFRNR